jgi:hypothetical protein
MQIEKSPLQTQAEFANTSSTRDEILQALQAGPDYRHAFMQECITSRLTAQIKAIRSDMDYKQFAQRIKKKPSWVYRLEDPIPTLLEVAEAFDIVLDVRFRPYSNLVDDVCTLNESSFEVPSFDDEREAGVFSSVRHHRRSTRARHRHSHAAPAPVALLISAGAASAVLSGGNPTEPPASSAVNAQGSLAVSGGRARQAAGLN